MVINYSILFSNNLSDDCFTSGNNLQKKSTCKVLLDLGSPKDPFHVPSKDFQASYWKIFSAK